jgi:hypothetical protein
MISYTDFQSRIPGVHSAFIRFLEEFKKFPFIKNNVLDLDAKYAVLKTENWKLYKEYFSVDKVILIGENTSFYRVYCIDSSNQKGLLFDLKSAKNLNDIFLVEEERIFIGDLTQQVSVPEAIDLLENCVYPPPCSKLNEEKFNELIKF